MWELNQNIYKYTYGLYDYIEILHMEWQSSFILVLEDV